MSKYERSSRSDRHPVRDHGHNRRKRDSSYDSQSDSGSSDSSYEPSPRRRSPPRHRSSHHHKSRAAYSDGENLDNQRGRDKRRYYESEDEGEESPTRRNVIEDLLLAVGLIRAKGKGDGRDRSSRSDRDDRYGDMPAGEKKKSQKQALQAALTAAAVEAFRTRKEGGFTPQRLMQIAGAAIAAGGLDAIVDRNPNSGGLKHIIESIVAGLAAGNTVGKQVKHSRPGGVKNKVAGGAVGMVAKKLLSRSLSRGPERRRSRRD